MVSRLLYLQHKYQNQQQQQQQQQHERYQKESPVLLVLS
jgi:hypothetical protein